MQATAFGILSSTCYIGALALIFKEILQKSPRHTAFTILAWCALIFHGIYLALIFLQHYDFNFGFLNAATLTAWFITFILLLAALDKPVEKLGVAIFPLAAAIIILDMLFPANNHTMSLQSWPMNMHILTSIIAFSLLNLAALQAILLTIQDKQLRRHNPKRLVLALPPLQAMETLLFQMIATGLLFLTFSLVSGFLFIDNLFAQHLAHKTALSIVAWIIFSGLLFGRWRYGWRGASAIRWTLFGFLSLLLAYFGSKLVLELILKRV